MGGGSWGGRPGQMGLAQFTEKWTSAGEVGPAKLDSAPPAPVAVIYDWDKIMTGDIVKTENMLNPPMLKWKSERGAVHCCYSGLWVPTRYSIRPLACV